MRHDEFARREDDARDLIGALGQLNVSRTPETAANFEAQVMARAAQEPEPRPRFWSRWFDMSWAPGSPSMRLAVAALGIFLLVGSVSQYVTWVNAYWIGIPPDELHQARVQEELWQKNFECAAQLDYESANYASLAGDQVTVVTWACPSGDVLVTLKSVSDEISERSIWVALNEPQLSVDLLDWLTPSAFAASPSRVAQRKKPKITVLCQKRLKNKRLLRRVQYQKGRCADEYIDMRNGKVLKRRKAPCKACR